MLSCLLEIRDLSIQFPTKTCLHKAWARIHRGDRIALIGENGAGKSTLLKTILGQYPSIIRSPGARLTFQPQDVTLDEGLTVWDAATAPIRAILEDIKLLETSSDVREYQAVVERLTACQGFEAENHVASLLTRFNLPSHRTVDTLSGGERMRLSWVPLLSSSPDLLILDEPTNHLDHFHRNLVFAFLKEWQGAAIIATHDSDLLHTWPKTIWSIHEKRLHTFHGSYFAWIHEKQAAAEKEHAEFEALKKAKKQLSAKLQQLKTRQERTLAYGKQKYASQPKMVRNAARERSERTMGRAHIKKTFEEKEKALADYRERRKPRPPAPRFHFQDGSMSGIEIQDGSIGYDTPLASGISLSIASGARVALLGQNDSGKTTFMRALLDDPEVVRSGLWRLPSPERIGYLDQHYHLLDRQATVDTSLANARPDWTKEERQHHLGTFLFLHHDSHEQAVHTLSEGEKARLSLALLASKAPDILLLDEVTNNLDLKTKEHLIEVLQTYPGTLIINCHEREFLHAVGIDIWFEMEPSKDLFVHEN